MTNVVLYIRVSTPEQAEEGFSLAAQETELRAYCDKKGYNVAAVYQDAGLSGKDIEGRPELRKLLHDVTAGSFDAVIVWSLSRFTRSLSDLCSACDHIEKYGCYLQSYTETFDARTPTGRMIRGILAVVAQWQREIITDNVRLALRQRATEGYPTTFCILGYDYDKQTGLIINSNEASVVQTVASTYLSTRNLLQTQVVCNRLGLCGKRGGKLTAWSIETILTRCIYAGFCSWQGEPMPGSHSPILPIDTYNRIQRLLHKAGRFSGRSRKYPLYILAEDGRATPLK